MTRSKGMQFSYWRPSAPDPLPNTQPGGIPSASSTAESPLPVAHAKTGLFLPHAKACRRGVIGVRARAGQRAPGAWKPEPVRHLEALEHVLGKGGLVFVQGALEQDLGIVGGKARPKRLEPAFGHP